MAATQFKEWISPDPAATIRKYCLQMQTNPCIVRAAIFKYSCCCLVQYLRPAGFYIITLLS